MVKQYTEEQIIVNAVSSEKYIKDVLNLFRDINTASPNVVGYINSLLQQAFDLQSDSFDESGEITDDIVTVFSEELDEITNVS